MCWRKITLFLIKPRLNWPVSGLIRWGSVERNCVAARWKCTAVGRCRYWYAWRWNTHLSVRSRVFWRTSSQSVLGGEALPLSVFQCVSYRNKKGGTIRDLFQSEAPPSTLFTNKHEQFTPKQDVNLHLLILVNFKLAVFRLRE